MLNDELKKKDCDLEGNVGEKRSLLINGGGKTFGVNGESEVVSLMGQHEMDRKIEEIKVMAREVRRIEGVKKEVLENNIIIVYLLYYYPRFYCRYSRFCYRYLQL